MDDQSQLLVYPRNKPIVETGSYLKLRGGLSLRVLVLSILFLLISLNQTYAENDTIITGYLDDAQFETDIMSGAIGDNGTAIESNETATIQEKEKTPFWKYFFSVFLFVLVLNIILHFLMYFVNSVFFRHKFIWLLLISFASVFVFLFYLNIKFQIFDFNRIIFFYVLLSVSLLIIHFIVDNITEDLWSAKSKGIDGKLINFFVLTLLASIAMFLWYKLFWLTNVI